MIARAAVVLALAAVVFIVVAVRGGDEPTFTLGEVERAFDALSLEVEPTASVFLKPVSGEDFSVVVFDTPEEAEWSYNYLKETRKEIAVDFGEEGFILRRGNVLVNAQLDVSDAVRLKIERALARIGDTN